MSRPHNRHDHIQRLMHSHNACPTSVCVGKPDTKLENVVSMEHCKYFCERDFHCNMVTYNPDTKVCRQYEECPKKTANHANCNSRSWEKQ